MIAAGEGRRLRPLTERWPKALLPIDRSPVLSLVLRGLAAAPVEHVTIVVGHLGEQIVALVGDGAPFGIEVAYARQPEPLGSADAVRRAVAAGAKPPLLVTAADTAYRPDDLAAAASAFKASGADGGLGVRPVPAAELAERSWVRVEHGRVVRVLEKPAATGSLPGPPLAAAPLWLLGSRLVALLDTVDGPPFQLADVFQHAIDRDDRVVALELGPTRDLTRPEDLVRHNFPYL